MTFGIPSEDFHGGFGLYNNTTEWYEIPVKVVRNEKTMIVPANQVQNGDTVWLGMLQYTAHDHLPDDDEEIMYIQINGGADAWPAAMFASK